MKNTLILVLCLCLSPSANVLASDISDQNKLVAVINVINLLLLDSRDNPVDEPQGNRIDLNLSELDTGPYTVLKDQPAYAAFELQESGVELCFDIESNTPFDSNGVVVEVNGEAVTANQGKDNCYQLSEPAQRSVNYVTIRVLTEGLRLTLRRIELASTEQQHMLLNKLTRGEWDEKAVRKVLRIFAFGGHARDEQIRAWSDMDPLDAVREMLNFEQHNLKLSPLAEGEKYTRTAGSKAVNPNTGNSLNYPDVGSFKAWLDFIQDDTLSHPSNHPIPADPQTRKFFGLNPLFGIDGIYERMITVRGLNPFRQKIGFWETNFHLAVNLQTSVRQEQLIYYYDLIMEAHAAGLPYYQVLGEAAKSSAIAMQYGHRFNEWDNDAQECLCSDDFAREIHQLFFGIFGKDDPDHENVTIPETAKMLTDMQLPFDRELPGSHPLTIDFGSDLHHVDPVHIFGQTIAGATAAEKIDALMPISMQHPESLNNLPVMIISVLAQDNLTKAQQDQLRQSWAAMGVNRVLLDFIHAYAISDMLHSATHYKFSTSHERAFYLANKHNIDNLEAFYAGAAAKNDGIGFEVRGVMQLDFAGKIFEPVNNVFGAQSSKEASGSALAFENNYNRMTEDNQLIKNVVDCRECDEGSPWVKKWDSILPARSDGNFYVKDVAEWLWLHVTGSMDNYTELERAHLYSLLGTYRRHDTLADGNSPRNLNHLLCTVADYQFSENAQDAPIYQLLSGDAWDSYCKPNNGVYQPHEIQALEQSLTGNDILNNPLLQNMLDSLGEQLIYLNASEGLDSSRPPQQDGGALRRHYASENINLALAFIFATPFVFVEAQ